MKTVLLDKGSLDRGDIQFTTLTSRLDQWTEYNATTSAEVSSRIKDAEIVITNKVIIDDALIAKSDQLKLICVAATGTNNIDLNAARKFNIPVCNVTAYATHSVVQHVFSLILTLNNSLLNYHKLVREGHRGKSKHFCLLDFKIDELYGKKLGIIGYGELGKALAKVASAFGLEVLVAESFVHHKQRNRISITDLLSQSDIVSLHCPLTPQTENLIDKNAFEIMKPTSVLINTARGGIVNETDLLDALIDKKIAGAALDVLIEEPPRKSALIEAGLDNLIITPHIAWASRCSRQKLIDEVEKNIQAFIAGEARNLVT